MSLAKPVRLNDDQIRLDSAQSTDVTEYRSYRAQRDEARAPLIYDACKQ